MGKVRQRLAHVSPGCLTYLSKAAGLAAMTQRHVVRGLAYSSIAQAGFILIGTAALARSHDWITGAVSYPLAYADTNLAASRPARNRLGRHRHGRGAGPPPCGRPR